MVNRRRCTRARARLLLGLWLATATVQCRGDHEESGDQGTPSDSQSAVDWSAFQQLFTVRESVVLEERHNVVTVSPVMVMNADGGFLIADRREHQLRIYARTGALERVIGAGTETADSLRRPHGTDYLPNGDIIATNLAPGRLTLVPARQEDSAQFIPVPLTPLHGVLALDDHRVVLMGKDAPYPGHFLHIWNLRDRKIMRSFLPPPQYLDSMVVRTFGRGHATRRGDSLAVVHELHDTLCFFDLDGNELSKVRIPADLVLPSGRAPRLNSPAEGMAWADQFTFLSDVLWIADNEVVVQWSLGSGDHLSWGLVQMDTAGHRQWTLAPTPRLLGVRDGEFVFQDPHADAPNRLIVAHRRPGS
jgi:hypothetical protein